MDATNLADELEILSDMLPEDVNTCLLVLQYIFRQKLQDVLPNMSVALRILLSFPALAA